MDNLLKVLTDEMAGLMRQRLNELIQAQRDRPPVLRVESAPGLCERFDESYLVSDTDMAGKLWRTVETIGGGGTIGIAGPRGCGKSILLRLLCRPGMVEPQYLSEQQKQKTGEWSWLPLLVSAPVSYEPREFLAHLFASLCRKLLGVSDQADNNPPIAASALRWPSRALQLTLGLGVVGAGAILIGLPALPVRGWQGASLVAIGVAGGLLAYVGTMMAVVLARSQRRQQLTATNLYASALEQRPFVGSLGAALTLAGVGWALVAAALSRAPDEPRNLAGAVIVGIGSVAVLYPFLSNLAQSGPADWARGLGRSPGLVQEAWTRLRELQFQQTVTENLSEAIKLQNPAKLPLSMESSRTRGVSLAQLPITYPELVAQFRTFCDHVVEQRLQLVVGIDELDKIDSPDTARDFLNGIKAIFGQPGCYFIATVSEDAIESFEQRGLPFRDVFDSCFDDIIAVQGLSFAEARTVLSRRVIGLEDEFVALCYCVSGGFPRDLIRIARAIVAGYPIDTPLATVSQGVVRTWLKVRIRTTLRRIGEVPADHDLRETLNGCIAMELSAPDGAAMVEFGRDLKQTAAGLAKGESQRPDDDGSRLSPSVALDQLAAFCYFCGTVVTFFDDTLRWTRLSIAAGLDSNKQGAAPLDDLASARRAFGLNAQLAWEHVDSFRRRWDAMASEPAASTGVAGQPTAVEAGTSGLSADL